MKVEGAHNALRLGWQEPLKMEVSWEDCLVAKTKLGENEADISTDTQTNHRSKRWPPAIWKVSSHQATNKGTILRR